jgi:hypothetical protein
MPVYGDDGRNTVFFWGGGEEEGSCLQELFVSDALAAKGGSIAREDVLVQIDDRRSLADVSTQNKS